MEPIFSKISKPISLFLSHIGPKQCWPIRLQNFKSNISLEQCDEIVYFFTCWYQKLRVDKNIGVVVFRCGCGHPGHKVNGWMNWTDFLYPHKLYMVLGKLKVTLVMHIVKYDCDLLRSWDSKICFISRINQRIELIFYMLEVM